MYFILGSGTIIFFRVPYCFIINNFKTGQKMSFQKYAVELVKNAGVIGAGGAGFPTHVKLQSQVKTVIANCAECEPLLGTDKAIIREETTKLLRGLQISMEAVGAKQGIVAIKAHYKKECRIIKLATKAYENISIHLMDNFYPAGDEFSLVYEVTKKIIPEGSLPLHIGVLVQNSGTLLNISDAVDNNKPVTHKYITITGEVENPGIYYVPIGLSIKSLTDIAKVNKRIKPAFIDGGPIMGRLVSADSPITKTSSGILVLPFDNPVIKRCIIDISSQLFRAKSACDACRLCTDLCPRYQLGHRIEPHLVMRAVSNNEDDMVQELTSAFLCCQCGVCDIYACPTGLSPRALYGSLRSEFLKSKIKNPLTNKPDNVRETYSFRKVPAETMGRRAGILPYYKELELIHSDFSFTEPIQLLLQQHVGAPALPIVRAGDEVSVGELVGEIPENALGARIHSSVNGFVESVNQSKIVIKPF